MVVGVITGHCNVRLHMNRIGVFNDASSCRKCGLYDEPAEHVLFDCKGLEQVRTAVFGKLTKGIKPPEEGLVRRIWEFTELSGLLH